jgi:diguanylate cyclase (GGDEF)-like protein
MNSSSPDHEFAVVPLRSLSLRGRLLLGFACGMLALLLVALLTALASSFSARQEARLRDYNADLALVVGFARAVGRLQLATSRYIYQGHGSALEESAELYAQWSERIQSCIAADCLAGVANIDVPGLLQHLDTYHDAFDAVVEARAELVAGITRDFAALQMLLAGDGSSADAEQRASDPDSVQNRAAALESELRAYYLTFAPDRLDAARVQLQGLQRDLRANPPAGVDAAGLARKLGEDVRSRIQQLRSYSYLVNVMMASEAYEMVYVADRTASEVQDSIALLESRIDGQRSSFYMVLALSIVALSGITLLVFIQVSRSISATVKNLAALFRRLAMGDEGDVLISTPHDDEISELIRAAKAFREENIRERKLLYELELLNATLEEKVTERTRQLEDANTELESLATTDNLTGISNRRFLDAALAGELQRAQRYARPLAVLMIDLDYFKQVNDDYGHLTGDQVLVAVASLLRDSLRQSDILGRWGGEEFMVICPETDLESGCTLAEKIRLAIAGHQFTIPRQLTSSFGVAVSAARDSVEALVARADRALYRAKEQGRNRVCSESPVHIPAAG